MSIQKIYKSEVNSNNNMLPGDPKGLPDESFFNRAKETSVFIDSNFLSKVSGYFGKGKYLVYDLITFSQNLAEKQKLSCKKIYYVRIENHILQYMVVNNLTFNSEHPKNPMNKQEGFSDYTAPPFQSPIPSKEEERKKDGYNRFVNKLKKREVIFREERCQRLKIDGKFECRQKGVDILLAMDLMSIPLKFSEIKKIILIASDSDFIPVINNLEEQGIKAILYTYYEKQRNTNFSRSNHLIKSVYKYVLLSKDDFLNAVFNKKGETK